MRYFLHIRDVDGLVSDEEGSDLPDIMAARNEARATARDLAMEDLKRGGAVLDRRIEIAADDEVIETMTVRSVTFGHRLQPYRYPTSNRNHFTPC